MTVLDSPYHCLDCGRRFYLTWAELPDGRVLWETDWGEVFRGGEGDTPLCPFCGSDAIADDEVEALLGGDDYEE